MKSVSKLALGALLVGMTTTALVSPAMAQRNKKEAPAAAAWKPKLGNDFRKAFGPVGKALDAKDYAAAATALPALEAAATAPDEKFVLGQVRLQIASNTKDEAAQRKAVDEMVLSGAGPQEEIAKLNFYRGNFAYKANDFPTAIAALTEAEKAGYQSNDLQLLLAESYFKSNQVPAGLAAVERLIASEKAAGRVPPQEWYARAASVSYQAKLAPEVSKWTRAQLEAYPTAENWRSALVIYRDNGNLDQAANLDLLRLMRASKALTSERDYYEYAQLAGDRGLPGEAKAVIEEGRATGAFEKTSANVNEMYTSANGAIKSDRASLPASEKQAASAANGKIALSTADAYLAYADYAKAAAMYRTAMEKGGIDADLANTRMGIALALSGQKDAAKTAFQAVKGTRTELAKFWTLWVDQSA